MSTSLATFAHPEFLVETEWLAAHLDEPNLFVIDCTVHIRFDPALVGPTRSSGQEDFERGHIPGAQFVDVVTELSDPTNPLPCTAPSATQFAAAMSRLGIGNSSRVVLYSAQNIYWAARVWWLLRLFGFDNAAVLNGGWQKWRRENRPSEAGPATPRCHSRFVIRAQRELIATKTEVLAAIGDPSMCTINALPADQHLFASGIHYGRPGHITGSLNVPAEDLLDPISNEFLPADRLRQHFENVGAFGKRVITYCGAGSAASADAMALMMLGHTDVRLYDGSLCEWAADPSLPMEAAPVPPSSEQAIAAIENSRLVTELHEALAREHAMAEVLKVINSSPGDLALVFDAMLERAMRLCEAAFGSFWTLKGDSFQPAAHRGVPAGYAEYLRTEVPVAGAGTGRARLLAGEPFAHIADLADEEPYRMREPHRLALVDLGKARTALLVPLRKDEAVIGFIMIYRQQVRAFTDKQITLLQNFAAQAVIAMENARLITETREALGQQTATAEVLGVINSSLGELTPVFEAMLDKALRLCGAAYGNLLSYNGEFFEVSATTDDLPGHRLQASPGTALEAILKGEDVVSIDDLPSSETYRHASPHFRELIEKHGYRSLLNVALRKDGALVGVIAIFDTQSRPFTDKQIALVQNFAAQAVIAMENARLITETREALEQQTATAEVLQVINASPGDLAPVFDAILDKAHTLCGAAHGSLTLVEGDNCRAVATRGMPEEFATVLRQPFHPGLLGERLSSGEPFVQIADLTVTPTDSSVHRAAAGPGGVRTLLAVPLRKDGVLLGYITANRREVRPFTDKQIALLENFAQQAVIAMENARLITETREALEQQTATAEVLGVINSSPGDLKPVFDAMLDKALRLCDAAYGVLNAFYDEQMRTVSARGEAHIVDWLMTREPRRPGPGTTTDRIVRGEDVVQIADVTDDAVYRDGQSLARRALVEIGGCVRRVWRFASARTTPTGVFPPKATWDPLHHTDGRSQNINIGGGEGLAPLGRPQSRLPLVLPWGFRQRKGLRQLLA